MGTHKDLQPGACRLKNPRMPRSRKGLLKPSRAPSEIAPSGDDEWGVDPDELEDEEGDDVEDLGEPPPLSVAEPLTKPSDALVAIGPPPDDALGQAAWARKVLMRQAYELMVSEVEESTRRREVRTILRDAARHFTDAARYDYMQMAKKDREELERRKRGKAAAKLEKASTATGGKLIPLRRDG